MTAIPTIEVLGIKFVNTTARAVVQELKSGGLIVVPSGPGLETVKKDSTYYRSLQMADIVLPDSGYMVLIWNALHRKKINRVSGLEFLKVFLEDDDVRNTIGVMLVEPRPSESKTNSAYLASLGMRRDQELRYIAPMYDKNNVVDEQLLAYIEEKKPKYVMINLGGGIQEKLGAYLRERLSYKPAIICTGAAIAFLTGHQAHIPTWADKFYLGWLMRCIQNPRLYIPRYFNSIGLVFLILRYGKRSPV